MSDVPQIIDVFARAEQRVDDLKKEEIALNTDISNTIQELVTYVNTFCADESEAVTYAKLGLYDGERKIPAAMRTKIADLKDQLKV